VHGEGSEGGSRLLAGVHRRPPDRAREVRLDLSARVTDQRGAAGAELDEPRALPLTPPTRHAEIAKSKAGKIAARQVEGATLRDERRRSRKMLLRLKGFVRAFWGEEALDAFGFNLPLPPRRPRLAADPTDPGPAPDADEATLGSTATA
jgi:hypothetical protein